MWKWDSGEISGGCHKPHLWQEVSLPVSDGVRKSLLGIMTACGNRLVEHAAG
jgi:hypothetical protein